MPEVKMKDGTAVQFGERSKVIKQSEINPETGEITIKFAFLNGEHRSYVMTPSHLQYGRAAMHGLNQRFGDANAPLEDVEDMIEAFEEISKQLNNNEWSERRGGDGLAGVSILAKALVEVLGKTRDEVKALLSTLSAAEKQALRRVEPVAGVVARIEAERDSKSTKKAGVDGLALLANLQAVG